MTVPDAVRVSSVAPAPAPVLQVLDSAGAGALVEAYETFLFDVAALQRIGLASLDASSVNVHLRLTTHSFFNPSFRSCTDCDGVLWSGENLLPGINEALSLLRASNKRLIFVTNNATKSRSACAAKFARLGVVVYIEEIFTSAYASSVYLKSVLNFPPDRKVYVIGMKGIEEELDAQEILHCGGTDPAETALLPPLDFSSLQDPSAIDPKVGAVLIGFDMHLSYLKLAKAFRHLTREGAEGEVQANAERGGCHFIITNGDVTFPALGGLWPEAGATAAPLVASTGRQATTIGKPNRTMLDCIQAARPFDTSRAIFFGDRLDTDILFAMRSNMVSVFVLTGVHGLTELESGKVMDPDTGAPVRPTFVLPGVGSLVGTS